MSEGGNEGQNAQTNYDNNTHTNAEDATKNGDHENGTGEFTIHPNLSKLPAALTIDFDSLQHKPWLEEGADISDYFNYGFDEELFKLYQTQVRDNFATLDQAEVQTDLNAKNLELDHDLVNFQLPHEAGGCGEPRGPEYLRVNTYKVGKSFATSRIPLTAPI